MLVPRGQKLSGLESQGDINEFKMTGKMSILAISRFVSVEPVGSHAIKARS